MTRLLALAVACLLGAACACPPAALPPRAEAAGLLQADGFAVLAYSTAAAVDAACDRLAGVRISAAGCYHGGRDIAVVLAGDPVSIRHEVCHHRAVHHRGQTPAQSEAECYLRWNLDGKATP